MGFLSSIFNPIQQAKNVLSGGGSMESIMDPAGILHHVPSSGKKGSAPLTPEEQLAAMLRDPNYRGFYPEPRPIPGMPPPTGNQARIPPTVHRPPPEMFPVIPSNYHWNQLAPTQAYQPTGAVQPLQVPPLGGMMNGR